MDETFLYNKSIDQRLSDYSDILWTENRILPASKVKNEWCCYLDLVVDRAGWKALWKIPREQCERYDISYPNVVIVYVENIIFATLTAVVKVLAVKTDIHLPDSISADLIDLYPTIEQDPFIALNIELTAENLDMLRFFYHNIWMPWDYDQDECIDWPSEHLESRIKLHFDLKSGLMPKKIVMRIKSLIAEGNSIAERYQQLQEVEDESFEEFPSNKNVAALAKLHFRMMYIRSEFNLLERLDVREALISECQEHIPSKLAPNWLVFLSTKTLSEHYEYMKKFETLHSKESVPQIAASLTDACKLADETNTIYLGKGVYSLNSLEDLENGGNLVGLFDPEETIITNENLSPPTFLLTMGSQFLFENVTFRFEHIASTGFSCRKGRIHFKNTVFESTNHNCQAIVIHPGAEVTIEKCKIVGFDLAIVCKPDGVLNLLDSNVLRNNSGLVLFEDARVNIVGTTISFSKYYGISLTSTRCLPRALELEELTGMLPKCNITGSIVENNGKGNYQIIRKMKSMKEIKFSHDIS